LASPIEEAEGELEVEPESELEVASEAEPHAARDAAALRRHQQAVGFVGMAEGEVRPYKAGEAFSEEVRKVHTELCELSAVPTELQ
jgi:hypothetical protein